MADLADSAAGYTERLLADTIAATRAKKEEVPRGECLYCGEPVEGVFCDPKKYKCRDSYESRQRLGLGRQ